MLSPVIPTRAQRALAWTLVSSLALLQAGCGSGESHSHSETKGPERQFQGEYPIKIVCTTGQVAELVSRVGDEHVEVSALMGPGIDPHLYRPVASDVNKLDQADAIFFNGLHLEGRMSDLFTQMARLKPTFAVTNGLVERGEKRLRQPAEFAGMYDPHVWHDVDLWAQCAHDVAHELGEFDPDHAEEYDANAHAYMDELAQLHTYCIAEIATIPESRRVMVTAHDAFGYFGKAYGIEVHGLKGISSDEEKDLAHQEKIQAMLIERQIPAVFVESAIAPRAVEALVEPCRAAGLDVQIPEQELYADALGPAGGDTATYQGMIRSNVQTIVDALSGE